MTNVDKVNYLYNKYKEQTIGSFHTTLWEIIVNGVRKINLQSCFVFIFHGKHSIGLADYGKTGYTPVPFDFNESVSQDERKEIVNDLNRFVFELEPKQADIIICSTF